MAPALQHSIRQLLRKPSLFPAADPRFTFHASRFDPSTGSGPRAESRGKLTVPSQVEGRFTVPLIGILMALLCVVGTACSMTDQNTKILFEDPRGTVALQTMSDRPIQATHPITLEPTLLAQLLNGIEIQDQGHGLQKYLAGPASSVRVFSDDQIRFLAPLLAEGLRTAAPDQRIEYRVHTTHKGSGLESSTTDTTAGTVYVYGRSLYVILSQYRYSPTRTNLATSGDMAYRSRSPDSSGLLNRIVLFTPSAADRSDSFDPPEGGKSTDRFLAIDYQLLQHPSPVATTTAPQMGRAGSTREAPAGTGASDASTQTTEALAQREAEIHALKDLVNKNNSDVETLRKELQSVQKRLGNQPPKPDSPKRKPTPQQK